MWGRWLLLCKDVRVNGKGSSWIFFHLLFLLLQLWVMVYVIHGNSPLRKTSSPEPSKQFFFFFQWLKYGRGKLFSFSTVKNMASLWSKMYGLKTRSFILDNAVVNNPLCGTSSLEPSKQIFFFSQWLKYGRRKLFSLSRVLNMASLWSKMYGLIAR